jgi:hypothetical protein
MKAWLWRKYELGRPAKVFARQPWSELEDGLIIWPAIEEGQWPELNRWQGLDNAFFGFASLGLAAPHACVYLATNVLSAADNGLLAKTWTDGADAAERYEWLTGNILGIWMGEKTPYLLTENSDFIKIFQRQPDFL